MNLTATAVVFEEPRKVALREIELPEPGDGDVVIDNVYTGISVGTEGLWPGCTLRSPSRALSYCA